MAGAKKAVKLRPSGGGSGEAVKATAKKPLKVLFAAGEARPFASSGGLADVVGALPKALAAECGSDGDFRVVIPLYKSVRERHFSELTLVAEGLVALAWRKNAARLYKTQSGGITFYFIDCAQYFDRDGMYGYIDDVERFAFFCRSVEQLLIGSGEFVPDILHCNDWQAALLCAISRERAPHFPKTVLTIHNVEYQAKFNCDHLADLTGLSPRFFSNFEYDGRGNLLKGGVMCADEVTTVSPTYARELLNSGTIASLGSILPFRAANFRGIINGIDYAQFDPKTCPEIAQNYDEKTVAEAKKVNQKTVEAYFNLPSGKTANGRAELPLVAMVTRLAKHKGIDLVCEMLPHMIGKMRFVIVANGEGEYERYFSAFAANHKNAAAHIGFDDTLAKQVYAAADYFLMPSLSEPCGLAQMIACRFGAPPVVRGVGGLADTIINGQNGYVFYDYWAYSLGNTLNDALNMFGSEQYQKIRENAMKSDFSWEKSAVEYLNMYRRML